MNTGKGLAALVALISIGVCHAADVYKWVDPDGRVIFGDKPPSDVQTQRLEIRTFSGAPDVGVDDGSAASNGVVMLSTEWCGVCKRARQYFASNGIAFTEYDVEKSAWGRAEFKRLSGRGVPIILVGKQRMNGFSAERFQQMLKAKDF